MATPLKIGLIGCGRIVQLVHLNALARVPAIKVIAVAEPDPDRRAEAASRLGTSNNSANYRDLLAIPDLDAVLVCSPNQLHAEVAAAAFDAGKHVYLEKPLAPSIDEARPAIDAWRRSGRVGMIGFNYRFHPTYRDLKKRIDDGLIGEPTVIRTVFSSPARTIPEWKTLRRTGGGVLLDLGSHHIDLVRFLIGREVQSVFACVKSRRTEADSATLQLTLEGGLVVQSFFTMCGIDEDRFEVYGTSGKLVVDRHHADGVEVMRVGRDGVRLARLGRSLRSLVGSPVIRRRLLRRRDEPSYAAAFAQYAASIRGNEEVTPDLDDARRCLEVIEVAEISSRTGQMVTMPLIAEPATG